MPLTWGASVYLGSRIGHVHSSACDSALCMPASRVSRETDKSAYSRRSSTLNVPHLSVRPVSGFLSSLNHQWKGRNHFSVGKKYKTKVWAERREKGAAIFGLIHWFFFFLRVIHFPLELVRQAEPTALPTMKTASRRIGKAGFSRGFIRGKRKTLFSSLTRSVGQKLLSTHASSDKTDCIQHAMNPSPQGWKTRARSVCAYGQVENTI